MFLIIETTSVTIKSHHYDNFTRSMRNVKNADILNNTVNVLYILVYCDQTFCLLKIPDLIFW